MFFRNQKPHQWTLEERFANLKPFRFEVKLQTAGALGRNTRIRSTGNQVGKVRNPRPQAIVHIDVRGEPG